MIIPRLTTERLVLRALERKDFDVYAEGLARHDAPGGPVDRRTAWRMFAASSGTWLLDGAGWWGIELAETKALAGICGVFYREANPDRETTAEELEIGWTVFAPFRRRGIASEAAAAALAYGFETMGAKRIIALIDVDNHASARVSERIGMRFERDVGFYGIRLRLYAARGHATGV